MSELLFRPILADRTGARIRQPLLMNPITPTIRFVLAVAVVLAAASPSFAQRNRRLLMNEQGTIQVRPSQNQHAVPNASIPPTVVSQQGLPEWELSLDEAIQAAMRNTDVVRVLSGVGAASSGQTIYAPAISNTRIDQARAIFDPTIAARNTFLRSERAFAAFDPNDPNRAVLLGSRSDSSGFALDINKQFLNGANATFRVGASRDRFPDRVAPLNPEVPSNVDLALTQPLLRGNGVDANAVPTVLAFIDTERSYFRLKQGLQGTVQGVIQGYWDLVQARTELWVVEQQIRAAEWANNRNETALEANIENISVVAQSRASLANFRASQIAARATILNRVAALRGILGLPPGSDFTIVPTTPPVKERLPFDWDQLLAMAESNRPDLVELQLVLEADRQRILLSENRARPQLDAVGLYRWNGLEGQMPIGDRLEADPGEFNDWSLAVNFSVPLTLRAERAELRQNELLLASDHANLRQRALEVSHELAFTLRSLEQLYEQYDAFRLARETAEISLDYQITRFREGITTFIDFLLAVNTWASSVTSESRAITQLNATLATLEFQTGSILETHGISLFEERYCALGPLGRMGKGRMFPSALRPTESSPRYEVGDRPSEEAFDLQIPSGSLVPKRLPAVDQE